MKMPREHLAESSRNNKDGDTAGDFNKDTALLRRIPWQQRRRRGNMLDGRILVA